MSTDRPQDLFAPPPGVTVGTGTEEAEKRGWLARVGRKGKEGSMLILTRKVDQGIVIQGNILVSVLRIDGDRVRIGISAPPDIIVLRQELLNPKRKDEATAPGREPSSRKKGASNKSELSGPESER